MDATPDTLALLRRALSAASGDPDLLAKAATFTQPGSATVGLQPYDLEAPAKNLYPVLTPLRNRVARVSGRGGIQANWKAITGINTNQVFVGVTEGRRSGIHAVSTKEYFAAYRTIGVESAVTYEADLSADGFDDLRARATQTQLQALMIEEEKLILAGNTSYALGITPRPTVTAATTGGTIGATTTVSVIVVALTFLGLQTASIANGVVAAATRTTADGYTDNYNGGAAQKSTAQTVVTSAGTTNSVTGVVSPVRGAFGYAWFVGASGSEKIAAITWVNTATFTSLPGTGQLASALPSSDCSQNSLVFDGLLSIAATGSGTWNTISTYTTADVNIGANGSPVLVAAPGNGLTADGSGGIVEFDILLQWFWDNLRLSPDRIIVSSQEILWIRKKILATGASGTNARFTFNSVNGQLVGGGMPKGYLNPFSLGGGPSEIPVELHPNMPPGTVLFLTEKLPYPMNNVSAVVQIRARRDYYQIDWPQRSRQYEYGVYSDEVLQHYFPPSLGLIQNLSPA